MRNVVAFYMLALLHSMPLGYTHGIEMLLCGLDGRGRCRGSNLSEPGP